MCQKYQSEHSKPGAIQAKITTALTAVGEPEPLSYLPGCDPDNVASVKTTSVMEWSYAPESMWRGPQSPYDHNVLKLAKAMVADCSGVLRLRSPLQGKLQLTVAKHRLLCLRPRL